MHQPVEKINRLLGMGLPPAVVVAIVASFIGIVTGAAAGLWFGAKWGWWLGAFYFMYNVVRHAY